MGHRGDRVAIHDAVHSRGSATRGVRPSGYGASASLHGAADHVADLKQAVDTLGVGRVFLVGNSAGAGIACQFALHWPDDVAGLLLLAPAVPGAPAPEMAAFPPAQRQLIQRALETREAETGASAEVRLWLDGAAANGGRVGGSIRRAAYAGRHRGCLRPTR